MKDRVGSNAQLEVRDWIERVRKDKMVLMNDYPFSTRQKAEALNRKTTFAE